MNTRKTFRKAYHASMQQAELRVEAIRKETDAFLECLAIECFGPVEGHTDDGFGPPEQPCEVECWHCEDKYSSSEMKRAYRPRMQGAISDAIGRGIAGLTPLWWCRNDDCDGAGFGHDIHPIKAKRSRKAKDAAE